jgi:hypothetical protein
MTLEAEENVFWIAALLIWLGIVLSGYLISIV